MRTSIWLIRHGQTELNKARRYQSSSDHGLTTFGQHQAEALAQRLRRTPFHAAVTSPTRRARETAEFVLGERAAPIVEDARWGETNHGRWEGLTYREVRERFPEEAVARFADALHGRASGGESLAEVQARVLAGWRALLQQHPGGRVLVATHATPIQIVLCHLAEMSPALHWRWRIDLASVTAIDVYGGSAIVRGVNEVPRLWAEG
ncbi:MAG: histidine phosphatase family protein [Roseiflexaceae bacterium]|nr:histidine phosphatase family protein [Roseiflexaceae bacterium]